MNWHMSYYDHLGVAHGHRSHTASKLAQRLQHARAACSIALCTAALAKIDRLPAHMDNDTQIEFGVMSFTPRQTEALHTRTLNTSRLSLNCEEHLCKINVESLHMTHCMY